MMAGYIMIRDFRKQSKGCHAERSLRSEVSFRNEYLSFCYALVGVLTQKNLILHPIILRDVSFLDMTRTSICFLNNRIRQKYSSPGKLSSLSYIRSDIGISLHRRQLPVDKSLQSILQAFPFILSSLVQISWQQTSSLPLS